VPGPIRRGWTESHLHGFDIGRLPVHTRDIYIDMAQCRLVYFARDFTVTEPALSGWANLNDDQSGVLGVARLPVPRPNVPAIIELHGDYLCWSNASPPEVVGHTAIRLFPSANEDSQTVRGVPVYESADQPVDVDFTGALGQFAKLRTGEDVQRFARRFGILEFCEHGLPATHNPRFLSMPLIGLIQSPSLWKPVEVGIEREPSFLIKGQGERPWCEPIGSEAIEGWLFWSRMAASLLNVAAALTRNLPTHRADWETIITEESDERPLLIDTLLARRWIARVYLQEAVNRWLQLANVLLSLRWPIGAEKASLKLEGNTFGLLGVQLLTAVTGAQGLTVCDGCSKPYVREGRRPQAGRANYCPDCRASKVPERIRQRRRRARTTPTASAK
jgi:hypothetical protein